MATSASIEKNTTAGALSFKNLSDHGIDASASALVLAPSSSQAPAIDVLRPLGRNRGNDDRIRERRTGCSGRTAGLLTANRKAASEEGGLLPRWPRWQMRT